MRQWVRNAAAGRAAGCPHGHPGPREQELGAAGNEWGPAGGAVGQRGRRADGETRCTPLRPGSTEAAGTQAAARPLRAAHLRDVMFLPPPAPHGPAARSGAAGRRHMGGPERGPAGEPTPVQAEPAGRANNPRQAWIPDAARPPRLRPPPPLAAGAGVTSAPRRLHFRLPFCPALLEGFL